MKYKDKKNLIIIIIMIIILSVINVWRFGEFERGITTTEPFKIEMPEIKPLELGLDEFNLENFGLEVPQPLTLEKIKQNYKTFISPSEVIQMKYPGHWQEIDLVSLKKINQKRKEYKIAEKEILFFAHQVRLIEYPPILTVISMPLEIGIEEVIQETERIAKEEQFKTEIIKKEIKDNNAFFEIKYKTKDFQNLFLKGEIVFTETRNYLIIILIPAELQEKMTLEIDFIFDSVIIK